MSHTLDKPVWQSMKLHDDLRNLLESAPSVTFAGTSDELVELAVRDADETGYHTVGYDVPGKGYVPEAKVCRVRNGVAANYLEPYMRRRDPQCTVIGDENVTDKVRYIDRFGHPFDEMRSETFSWLEGQDLACFVFYAGEEARGLATLAICPANAGFFALGLALLQGILPVEKIPADFEPQAVIYVAPPFRHTRFEGQQVVVHHRHPGQHELFSYNLYPGPSAKKGVYGMLLNLGEEEGWVTAHCSTVQVVTPYDNRVVIMHEGASGGGKSELLEYAHRQPDGTLLLGENTVTDEQRSVTLARGCELHPVTDDMALCLGVTEGHERKLRITDAESAWFLRVNHIQSYGVDPHLEKLLVSPPEPLLYLNIDAVPSARALIWDHIEDEPGVPCPNPRVVVPRHIVPDIVDGEVTVDIRSFGVRCPPCTSLNPTYGIMGLFHVLPASLAWLWRLAAPRGHANPSIVDGGEKMTSEGVGSYWPFATGRKVDQANLLYEQIMDTSDTLFILCPNQHIGAWRVSFMPQWLTREYLARRGLARFRDEQLQAARCPLLGRVLKHLSIEGTVISHWFLEVETQPEVGVEGYDAGAKILETFFHDQVRQFLHDDLHPGARKVIEACLDGAREEDYEALSQA